MLIGLISAPLTKSNASWVKNILRAASPVTPTTWRCPSQKLKLPVFDSAVALFHQFLAFLLVPASRGKGLLLTIAR
jgi:hypothetical protein